MKAATRAGLAQGLSICPHNKTAEFYRQCAYGRAERRTRVRKIKLELLALERLSQQLANGYEAQAERYALGLCSSRLQIFYSHCERILGALLEASPGKKTRGLNASRLLLREACLPIAGVRPSMISAATHADLCKLRRYRNHVKNIYGYQPAPEVIAGLARTMTELYPRFAEELEHYKARLGGSEACEQRRNTLRPH